MKALADAEEPAERHDRIFDLPRPLVDHDRIDRAQSFASSIVDGDTDNFVR